MSLTIYTSSSVDELSKKIAQRVKANSDIFTPQFIVTSNSGLNNWLKISLASQNGIAANLAFIKNDKLVEIAYGILCDNKKALLTSERLQWYIYDVLGSEEFKTEFPEKASYYNKNELKKYALSQKLAGLFDKYQIYIPDEFSEDGADWQGYIWQEVKNLVGEDIITRESIKQEIFDEIEQKQDLIKSKLPSVHIYLNIEFTPYHIEVFKILSNYIDISFYIFNPFVKSEKDNPLVGNWGNMIRNSLSLLPEENFEELEFKDATDSGTLLSKIQGNILQNNSDTKFSRADLFDTSITINSNYTTTREVEVLYNYLIKTISESGNNIGARDILVMTTDIDLYAPAIYGIFDSGPIKLPYSISDNSYTSIDSALNAIEEILLLDDRYKAENIVQLLEFSYIREKYQFEDLELIRTLIINANIKFGVRGDKTLETNTVSWFHGLKRLIYGFCIADTEWFEDSEDRYLLVDIVEGADAHDLIRLHKFFEDIVVFVEQRKSSKTLQNWELYINDLVNTLIIDENEGDSDISLFKKKISDISSLINDSEQKLEYRVIKKYFIDIISDLSSKSNYANKGITFCSMNEMRNVPYKVIAVLGLNLREFPRKDTIISYDLTINRDLKITSKNDTDKYLFLQTLMSAKQKLYLSYIGKDNKNNSLIPPSSVIDDLKDFIEDNYTDDIKDIENFVCEQPLHGFSQAYFDKDQDRYYTYLYDKETDIISLKDKPKEIEVVNVSVKDFISFFKNPFKYFYNHTLGIYYGSKNSSIGDSELFELDNLQEWSLKGDWIYSDKTIEDYREVLIEIGDLPLCEHGKTILTDLTGSVSSLKQSFEDISGKVKQSHIGVNIELNNITLSGKISKIYNNKYIFVTVSKDSSIPKYLIEFYITYLILKASGSNIDGYFFTSEGNFDQTTINCNITAEQAKSRLEKLMELFVKGQNSILPFSIELGWEETKNLLNENSDSIKKKFLKYISNERKYPSPELSIEVNSGFFDNEDHVVELKKNIRTVLENLFTI